MEQHHLIRNIEEILNKLTRDDLERLKANAGFYPGDRVSWADREGMVHFGRVTRINTKTISTEEDD